MRIVLVTDSHLAPGATACNSNWHAVRAFVTRAKADLTIHLGDITVDGAGDAAQFDWALAECASWPTPLRFLPGNHDIGDNPPGVGVAVKDPLDPARLAQYRAGFGPDHWCFDADGWRLVGLNAQLFGTGNEAETAQWAWLTGQVTRDRPIALFLHKPLFQTTEDDPPHIRYLPQPQRRKVLDLLSTAEVPIVLSGHTHQYLDRMIGGRRHVWVPSTAFWIPDSKQERVGEKLTGIGVLELAPGLCQFDLVCANGVAHHCLTGQVHHDVTAAMSQRSA